MITNPIILKPSRLALGRMKLTYPKSTELSRDSKKVAKNTL